MSESGHIHSFEWIAPYRSVPCEHDGCGNGSLLGQPYCRRHLDERQPPPTPWSPDDPGHPIARPEAPMAL